MTKLLTYSLLGLTVCVLISSCTKQKPMIDGLFVWGHEVREFTPCGGETLWWTAEQAVTEELLFDYQQYTGRLYQAIYVQIRGEIQVAAKHGFASEYPGVFQITEVLNWQIIPPADCQSAKTSHQGSG